MIEQEAENKGEKEGCDVRIYLVFFLKIFVVCLYLFYSILFYSILFYSLLSPLLHLFPTRLLPLGADIPMTDGRRGKIEERKRRLFMETYIICVRSVSVPCVCMCVALSVHLCVCV